MINATEPTKNLTDTIEFELTDLERLVAEVVPESAPPGKWPAFNAIRHLNRAWQIRETDPDMAAFRSITAVEESATAVFHAVKRRGYDGAKKLNLRNHVNKNALTPFIMGIAKRLSEAKLNPGLIPQILIDRESNPKRLVVQLRFDAQGPLGNYIVEPKLPLDFSITEGKSGQEKHPLDLHEAIRDLTKTTDQKQITKHLMDRANTRNQILYATPEGWPGVKLEDFETAFIRFRESAFMNLLLFLLIDPYPERQSFAQHCLDEFLRVLGLVPDVEFK